MLGIAGNPFCVRKGRQGGRRGPGNRSRVGNNKSHSRMRQGAWNFQRTITDLPNGGRIDSDFCPGELAVAIVDPDPDRLAAELGSDDQVQNTVAIHIAGADVKAAGRARIDIESGAGMGAEENLDAIPIGAIH